MLEHVLLPLHHKYQVSSGVMWHIPSALSFAFTFSPGPTSRDT